MAVEYSYGVVPLRKRGDTWEVLLVEHASAHYWGFPKGHIEEGESPKVAAVRELKEETNLDIVRFLSGTMIEERYHFTFRGKHVDKTVGYFIAEVAGELILQQAETSDGKWVPIDQAGNHITYDTDKNVLKAARKFLE